MGKPASKWTIYLDRIKELVKEYNYSASPITIARIIDIEEELNLSKKELDSFRTYIKRKQSKLRKERGLSKNAHTQGGQPILPVLPKRQEEKKRTEKDDEAILYYKGERSITSLQEAIEFFEIDEEAWEVDKYECNSWDVTSKTPEGELVKGTNYQVHVWLSRKKKLELEKPQFRHITIKPTQPIQMWVIIGCVHRPFHDKVLWDKFLRFLEMNTKDITGVHINGDYLDLRSLSSHDDFIPEGIDLEFEYNDGLQGIMDIESRLNPDIDKIFQYGNHEDRFFRDRGAIRKYGKSLPSPHEALELEESGWKVSTDWKNGYTTLGNNLDVYHGVKVGQNATKDQLRDLPTRDHIFNHTHRFSTYSNNTNTAYNIGCMIDFESDAFKYVDRGIRASWSHGLCVVYIDNKGNNHVYPIKVDNDKGFFFKGVVY